MLEGSQSVDASSCDAIKPASGFEPDTSLTLVRKPNDEPSTDSSTDCKAYADVIKFTVDTNISDISQQVQAGDTDRRLDVVPPHIV
jgi:hypothetical protein